MKYRLLGGSDLNVSVISFGAWQIGDPRYWGPESQADADATVGAALDAGVNLFDTAEWYGAGESERVLGRALGSRRKQVFIASKVSAEHCAPADLRVACEASLQRLGADVIDLYQVHWPFRHVPFEEAHEEMEKLRSEGKIRHIGVSNFGVRDLAEWMKSGACVSDQLGYSLLFRSIEYEIVPACLRYNVGVLAYMPLMQGLLAGRWKTVDEIPENRRRTRHFASARSGVMHTEEGCESLTFTALSQIRQIADRIGQPMANVALAWLIQQPAVTSVIVGGRNPAQLRANLAAAELQLDPGVIWELSDVTEPLKQHFGANADMWRSGAESRIR